MICYIIARQFGKNNIDWCLSENISGSTKFFINSALTTLKKQIVTFWENLESNGTKLWSCDYIHKEGYHIYAMKINDDCCGVVCNTQLNEMQMKWLAYNLLTKKIDSATVCNDFDKYSQDFKVTELRTEVESVKEILLETVDKLQQRGDNITQLIEQTNELQSVTLRFRNQTEKLNSCWPSFCTVL